MQILSCGFIIIFCVFLSKQIPTFTTDSENYAICLHWPSNNTIYWIPCFFPDRIDSILWFNSDWPWTERSHKSPIAGVGNIITAKIHIWGTREAQLCIKGITDRSDSLWNSFLEPNKLRKHSWPCCLRERSKQRFKQTSFKPLVQQTLLLHYKMCGATSELILSTCIQAKTARWTLTVHFNRQSPCGTKYFPELLDSPHGSILPTWGHYFPHLLALGKISVHLNFRQET